MGMNNKCIENIAKKYGKVFIEHEGCIFYFVYENEKLISKSLPVIRLMNNDEIILFQKLNGGEGCNIINGVYAEFFDPDVVEYKEVTATHFICSCGSYARKGIITYGNVPTETMLQAANALFSIIEGPMKHQLFLLRIEEFRKNFAMSSLDGTCAIVDSTIDRALIPNEFVVLLHDKKKSFNRYFVALKTEIENRSKDWQILLTIPKEHAGFVLGLGGDRINKASEILGKNIKLIKK